MKGLRVVRPVSDTPYPDHGGFVTVEGYRYFHKALSDWVGRTVRVEWTGGREIEAVDVYVSGHYLCEAMRPHLFETPPMAPTFTVGAECGRRNGH